MNEGLSYYIQRIQDQKLFNSLQFSITVIEFSFISYFFYLASSKIFIKKTISFLWIAFIILIFIDYFYVNDRNKFDSIALGIESIVIIILCIVYLLYQLKQSNSLLFYSTFNFWVTVTLLIYFSGTFFLYIMTENSRQSVEFQILYTIINSTFNILKNILLSIAMTMKVNSIIKSKESAPNWDEDVSFQKTN